MIFTTYILRSIKFGRYYIGHTGDIEERLKKHNAGLVKSTKYFLPWEIVYTEKFQTKAEAYKRELEIKSYKSGILFNRLVGRYDKIMRKPKTTKYLLKI